MGVDVGTDSWIVSERVPRDKNKVGRQGEKSLLSEPGSELRLGGKEKEKV